MRLALIAFPYYRTYAETTQHNESDTLRAALLARGVTLELVDGFSAANDFARFDAVLVLGCWGYHKQPAEFCEFLERLGQQRIPVLNPPSVLRWNMDKKYLIELQRAGVAVAPLLHFPVHSQIDLAEEIRRAGWSRYVLKPTISANALHTQVCQGPPDVKACALAQQILSQSGLLIQPYFEELVAHGELSLLYFGGEFSHAVCKVPKAGDFRSQPDYGACVTPITPSAELLAQIDGILNAAPGPKPLPYARVDGFLQNGRLQLIELELIEPFLFLHSAASEPAAAAHCARALIQAVSAI